MALGNGTRTWWLTHLAVEIGHRKLILNIPLSFRSIGDVWYWTKEEKGLYTLKSGYMSLLGFCYKSKPKLSLTLNKFTYGLGS